MKTYEITFSKSKDTPTPTDFFHLPAGFELRNMTCTHYTTRSEKWEYEIKDVDAGSFEYAAQNCRTTSSFREIK